MWLPGYVDEFVSAARDFELSKNRKYLLSWKVVLSLSLCFGHNPKNLSLIYYVHFCVNYVNMR